MPTETTEARATEIRREVREVLEADLEHEVQVLLGPSDYKPSGEAHFVATIIVGEPTPANEEEIDRLHGYIPQLLQGAIPGAVVTRCSGHRLFADRPGDAPKLGAEWVLKVLT